MSLAAFARGSMVVAVLGIVPSACGKPAAECAEFGVDHGSTPSRGPTSFHRDVATATWSSCSDGRSYSVRCRHGSLSTDCDCAIDGDVKLRVERDGRLADERAAALAFTNETCEWELRVP